MNCRACGTQLPLGATHCPQCGVPTPYDNSLTQAPPDAPTVVSFSDRGAQQPEAIGYGSTTYQDLYELPGTIPPPPPPLQRKGKRLGGIVGAVLLVLLLLGGGMFAWTMYSAPGKPGVPDPPARSTATPQHFTAQGTATRLDSTTTSTQQDGNDQIYRLIEHWINSGDIAGQFTSDERVTNHQDKTAAFTGKDTCICTVAGKSGTLVWSFSGTTAADGSFQGQFFDLQGTGDLAKLRGQGTFQGQGDHDAYTSELYFDF